MATQHFNEDVVSHVIKYCIRDHAFAQKVFNAVIMEKHHTVRLPDGEIELTEENIAEFVERYSSEVEPTIWESKRRKN